MNPNDYKHIFATLLPPSVEDSPICGAALDREWLGRGKPECPACNAKREELLALSGQQLAQAIIALGGRA